MGHLHMKGFSIRCARESVGQQSPEKRATVTGERFRNMSDAHSIAVESICLRHLNSTMGVTNGSSRRLECGYLHSREERV